MRVQIHMQYSRAEHNNSSAVALFAGRGKVKHEAAPHSDLALIIPLEPDASQVDGVVKQHNVHGFAVAMGSLEDRVLDGFGAPPVPDGKG